MTQDEQDAQLGRIFREINEHVTELNFHLVMAKRLADRYKALAEMLDAKPFDAATADDYKDVLDFNNLVQLERSIRGHEVELKRLRDMRNYLGYFSDR